MFEPEVFRKQMYCTEESTFDVVEAFRRPGNCAPLPLLVGDMHLLRYVQKTRVILRTSGDQLSCCGSVRRTCTINKGNEQTILCVVR